MDTKYIILGINIMVVSAIVGIYGYLINSPQLIGVSLSSILIGSILTVLGYSYGEPTTNLLIDYSKILSQGFSIALEDLRLSSVLPSTYTKDDKVYLVISRRYPRNLDELSPGVNIVDGEPVYITLLPNKSEARSSLEALYDVESRLRDVLIGEYGLCARLEIGREDNILRIRLIGVDRRLLDIPLTPLNPLDLTVISVLTDILGIGLSFRNRVVEGGEYIAEFMVMG